MKSRADKKWHNWSVGDFTPPPGYVYIALEGQPKTFTAPTNVAFGANGQFVYKSNVKGSITFDTATFGDPIKSVTKAGYAELLTAANNPLAPQTSNTVSGTTTTTGSSTTLGITTASSSKKWLIYGGIGIVIVIAGFLIIKKMRKK